MNEAQVTTTKEPKQLIMRKLPMLLVAILAMVSLQFFYHTQNQLMPNLENESYEIAWKKVDSLERKGLPKSALEQTLAIYEKAKKEKNSPQTIKAIIYKGKYQVQLEEDGLVKAIDGVEKEVEAAPFPDKAVLQSMLAEMYSQYLQNNLWKIRNRTTTVDFKNEDVRTWTMTQLIERSRDLYLASVDGQMTKQIEIDNFDILLRKGKNTELLRPTLYDFLAHRTLQFFNNQRNQLIEPAYKFHLREAVAFAPVKEFVKAKFIAKDNTSAKYQAILLYQELLKSHIDDNSPEALIDADLMRLKFMYDNAIIGNKEELYEEALEALGGQYLNNPAYSEIVHKLANLYHIRGQKYQANPDNVGKFDFLKAYNLCTQAITKYPKSIGASYCRNLQSTLMRKELQLQVETVNLPNQPILTSIKYRNVKQVYLKVVEIGYGGQDEIIGKNQKQIVNWLNRQKIVKQKTIDLPQEGDYRQHRTEVGLEKLPFGYYGIMVADNSDFIGEKGAVGYTMTHISNLANWSRTSGQMQPEMVIVDRTTGAPLEGVIAELYTRKYNAISRKYNFKKTATAKSDAKGMVTLKMNERDNFKVKLIKGEDVLFLDDNYSNYFYNNVGPSQTITHFFLDRAIYRPGQTVYFKGIVIEKSPNGIPTIQTNKKVEVTFFDVNRQEVEKMELRTNEYGTINGSFTAPRSGLLGNMSIVSSAGGAKYFNVEEYKRPKFEVTFNPITGSYKLGEEVTVEGVAKAFAGNNIDNAKAQYRVVRQVRFPWRPYFYFSRYNPYQRPDMEITNGEITTDAEGKFKITFEAIPDESVPAEKKPEFNYKIYVDVTDITGETQSNDMQTSVGYIALKADVTIPNKIEKSNSFPLKISTKNLAGEFEAATVEVTVHQLKTPEKTFKTRFWDKPDTYLLSEKEFEGQFPNFAYKNENEKINWKLDKSIYKENIDTRLKRLWSLPVNTWDAGDYLLVLKTKDKYGQSIEVKKYFQLYDLSSKEFAGNDVLWLNHPTKKHEPSEIAEVCLATAADKIHTLIEVEKKGKIVSREWKEIQGKEDLQFSVLESDRGNFHYHITFTHDNRTYKQSKTVRVPWSNKELTIEYSTFRDKLKPGQEEEWRIKVMGPKSEKIAAELVATMYDASLDQFAKNDWLLDVFPLDDYPQVSWTTNGFNSKQTYIYARNWQPEFEQQQSKSYNYLNWFGFPFYGHRPSVMATRSMSRGREKMAKRSARMMDAAPEPELMEMSVEAEAGELLQGKLSGVEVEENDRDYDNGDNSNYLEDKDQNLDLSEVKVRTNLNETVFFMPDLHTDEEGNIIIKFTMNEALTRWKFLGLATTKDLKIGTTSKEIVTQKELMVQPNAPRFFREGDKISFTAKVSNLTENDLTGEATIQLFDALTMQPIDAKLSVKNPIVSFTAKGGQSAPLSWTLDIPFGEVMAVTHRVIATAGNFSDGEESSLPVLTNRMLVTETKPLALRGKETKTFTLESLKNAANSSTLTPHKYTLEFTSNPAWYAVQALPYLMEYPYDCTEQIFNRYYANALASTVANAHPKIKTIFDSWKGTDAMKSNLNKNQELKSALLEETPWVLAAQSEEEQKKNIGLLFDLNRMADEQAIALAKITERQLSNGGFAWFPGGRDSWYITQNLVEGMGHLQKLNALDIGRESAVDNMLYKAVAYTDARLVEQYNDLKKRVKDGHAKFEDDHLSNLVIHYLYARSFFPDIKRESASNEAYDYYVGQAEQFWLNKGVYQEGMIGLALNRMNKTAVPQDILKSLKERALQSEELGMYWKNPSGFRWYQLPIETHAMSIELFEEVANDQALVNELKIWLLKNKQTNHWKTTKATSAVTYALLMSGDNWILENQQVNVTLGKGKSYAKQITAAQKTPEAGTGYFKTSWNGKEVQADMANIKVKNPNKQPAWGAVYWQYFEDLDKVTTFKETPLIIDKQLFKETNSDKGPVMTPIAAGGKLQPGDKLKVRIEIRVDRAMEYVHLKDMRASGFEPMNVISGYKWANGLGYYESTGDVATNFFMDHLPKGTHVFEYPLRVVHEGDFSNGVTSMQCMYAPEFSSHSEGIRVTVE